MSVTLADVAAAAGVSIKTVSRVVNNDPAVAPETRKRVQREIRRLGYRPHIAAKTLASKRAYTLGLAVPQTEQHVLHEPWFTPFLLGVTNTATKLGFGLMIKTTGKGDEGPRRDYRELFGHGQIDGIILTSPKDYDKGLELTAAAGFPLVVIGRYGGNRTVPSVDEDNVLHGYLATKHLIEREHHRIGIITASSLEYTVSLDRLEGYRRALQEAGLPYEAQLVIKGDFTFESGATAIDQLLALPEPPTAVFAAGDLVAIGALQAIKQHGLRIPEEVALVGSGNSPVTNWLEPPLTSVGVDAFSLGEQAVKLLVQMILHPEQVQQNQLELKPKLTLRGST